MDKARWPVVSPFLDELLELDTGARRARLVALRSQDAALADELQSWLARADELEDAPFLQAPALPAPPALEGSAVGPYTIIRPLGEGGMGSVWLARRDDGRFESQVAIKFLRTSLAPRADTERFAREGRILARLAHPHIARLLDAGVHGGAGPPGGGQPYLVLEYVDGVPIDRYCEARQLDLPQRLALFLDVLSAVAHAHQRLILHRDIKPSNILVTADGQVKLLDFGIAKLMGGATEAAGSGTSPTDLTRRGGRAFTLGYAAPEQLQEGEVTTATDVYALGVLLYVLLGGRHPTAHPAHNAVDRMRATLEHEPRRLSESVRRAGGPQARRLARALQGDLDTIVARALKKAPAERYSNAEAFAEDLRRQRAHEPIAARRDSALYVLAKFVRRHRVGVTAATAVVLAAGTGAGAALHEAGKARRQQVQVEGLIEFMLGDLRQRLRPVGRLDTLDAVGERARAYYATQDPARLDPESLGRRARALHLLGEIADDRGDLARAERMFSEAAQSTAAQLQREPDDTQRLFDHAQSQYWVGYLARRRGQAEQALRAFSAYRALADELAAREPERLDWRIEQAHAHLNLGVLALEDARASEALQGFMHARDLFASATLARDDLRFEWANAVGWIAKANEALGDMGGALAAQQEKYAVLARPAGASSDRHGERLMAHALWEQARLRLALGQSGPALHLARAASSRIDALVALDGHNLAWQAQANLSRLAVAEAAWAAGHPADARAELARAAADVQDLLRRSADGAGWQMLQRGAVLRLQARLTPQTAGLPGALEDYLEAGAALAAAGHHLDAEQTLMVAAAETLLAERLPDHEAERAQALWRQAAARLRPASVQGDPAASCWRARALAALGQAGDARALLGQIRKQGYRHPDVADLRKRLAAGAG